MRGFVSFTVLVSCLAPVFALSLAACTTPRSSPPPSELAARDLLTRSLAAELGADAGPDLGVIITAVDIPPHTTLDWHWHPGEEYLYFLEGAAELLVEGEPPIDITPGTAAWIPYRSVHTARTGPEGARVIVFRVHPEGEPVRVLKEPHASDR